MARPNRKSAAGGMDLPPKLKFAAARLLIREKVPYIRSALLGLVVVWVPGLGTMGVTYDGILMVDEEFVAQCTIEEVAGVLYHEVWHILRVHNERGEAMGCVTPQEKMIANYAGDAEINDDIIDAPFPLPTLIDPMTGQEGGPIMPKTFGAENGRLMEEYYRILRKQSQPQQETGTGDSSQGKDSGESGQAEVDSPSPGSDQSESDGGESSGESNDGPGAGKDSSAGAASGTEGKAGVDSQSSGSGADSSASSKGEGAEGGAGEGSGTGEAKGSGGSGSGKGKPTERQAGWGACGSAAGNPLPAEEEIRKRIKGRTKAELKRMKREVAEAIKTESARSRGTVPGGLLRWAEKSLKPAQVPWQRELATICRSAVAYRPGAIDYKYDRPSRRQAGLGHNSGDPILPCMRQPIPNVLIVVDTSGSMGTSELTDGLREANGILKSIGVGHATFMACDAQVHSLQKVRSWRDILPLLKGGGGTSFIPVFEQLRSIKPRPDVLVFVTDGMGDCPEQPPPGVKVIWLLVGAHRQKPHMGTYGGPPVTWGKCIYLGGDPNARDEAA